MAVEASPDGMVTEELRAALLERAGVTAVSLKRTGTRRLVLADDMPVTIDASFDLREETAMGLIGEAADALRHGGERTIRVMGIAPGDPDDTVVDIVMPEAPMFASMLDYSGRILVLSIILAFVVASLVYISLHWLMVLPLGRMTDSLVSFRRAPEDASATVRVSGRRDEIGLAQRELQVMQRRVRAALRQRERLAAVGAGVAKINHDLRNMLAHGGRADRSPGNGARSGGAKARESARRGDRPGHRHVHPYAELCDGAPAGAAKNVLRALATGGRSPSRASHRRGLGGLAQRNTTGTRGRCRSRPALQGHHQPGAECGAGARLPRRRRDGARERLARCGPHGGRGRRHRLRYSGLGARITCSKPLRTAAAATARALGLAIARDLMRNLGGDIHLERSDSSGTVFRLRVPDPSDREAAQSADG